MRKIRRTICLLTAMLCALGLYSVRADAVELPITSRAALLMEKSTGQVLFAQNEHEQLEPASVTKIMTLLLTMEAIDSGTIGYDDVVTVSAAAAGMGGSQVYLAEGEQITVEELLKSVCVASGNDAAVALAEKVAGVHELFVEQMNRRASELGMADTHFVNCTGLTAEGHVTSAHDIALMSRELLLHHPDIRRFTTIWMDTVRDGAFGLSNTNKLIRFYDGATGLKTGFTSGAGYCLSASAQREGLGLIGGVLHQRHGGAGRHGADRRHHESAGQGHPHQGRQGAAELRFFHLHAGGRPAAGAADAGTGSHGRVGRCTAGTGGREHRRAGGKGQGRRPDPHRYAGAAGRRSGGGRAAVG